MQIEQITWRDATSRYGSGTSMWISRDHLELVNKCNEIVSVGYVLSETDDNITIAQSVSNKNYGFVLNIPNGFIVERKTLG